MAVAFPTKLVETNHIYNNIRGIINYVADKNQSQKTGKAKRQGLSTIHLSY